MYQEVVLINASYFWLEWKSKLQGTCRLFLARPMFTQGSILAVKLNHFVPLCRPINPTPRSRPFPPPAACLYPHTAEPAKRHRSPSFSLSSSSSLAPSPSKSPSKKKKKNLQRKVGQRSISALLIHWLPSRTQSSHVKSLDGSYLPCCCWWGTATQMAVICILFWKPNMHSFFLNTPPTQFSRGSLPILTLFLPKLYAKLIRKRLIHSQ